MIGEHIFFDIAAWLSALLAAWLLYRWRFRQRIEVLSRRLGAGYFVALTGGGVLGSYGFGTLNVVISGQSGVGRSILGGLFGAIVMVEIYKLGAGIRGSTGAVLAVPFALAVAIGRIGCYQAGLEDFTYGVATDLAWGVDYGDGIARHPVQLYEALTMAVLAAAVLAGLWRRSAWAMAHGFYVAVGVYSVQRFLWEFLKPYAAVLGPLNLFHLLCLILIVYAISMVYFAKDNRT